METTYVSNDRWVGKENGIIFSYKKEGNPAICDMDELFCLSTETVKHHWENLKSK